MSRLTGTDAYGLMEAYNNVYAPQELTEEQVWEEVETWVNSLLEEGYDLSDYTWEEMYESYLEEQAGGIYATKPAPISNTPYVSRFARPRNAGTPQTYGGGRSQSVTVRPPIGGLGGLGAGYRGSELQQSAAARASQVGTPRQGTAGGPAVGGNTPIGPSPKRTNTPPVRTNTPPVRTNTPPVRTNTPPARTVTPPARTATPPAGPKPTAATTTPTPSASPARPSISSQADEIRKMRARSLQRQGKTLDAATVSGATRPAYQANSFDVFDVIKGHLIDEGYADTEEAALVIMANMSEEWKQSIVG